ncbi:MAG: cytosine/uracil/thiamine/allantoin permease [Glaciecola sp.]|jgi:cytosine/uracil/thiamine/allantoin permease
MKKLFNIIFAGVHLFAAIVLTLLSLIIMVWSIYEVISGIKNEIAFIPSMLQSVAAIIIASAIIDVAQYMMEEEVFKDKELRDPQEARRTITKIIVIITIAVSIEGLVFIFKAGTKDLSLLLYPALIILVSAILIIALGIYQKLSATIEKTEKENA